MSESASLPAVYLLPGESKRLHHGHPWAYSNEVRIDEATRALPPGQLVRLLDAGDQVLGLATFNPYSLIALRLLTSDPEEPIDQSFFARRLRGALALREALYDTPFYRLVHSEADGLPGLVIDRYGDASVCQINSAGMERLLPHVLAALDEVLAPRAVVLRADSRARDHEGLERYVRLAKGAIEGPVELLEEGVRFLADLTAGQKTGWYFDQRESRSFVARLGPSRRVLDVYCYTGGFAVRAAAVGAREGLGLDDSQGALALAARAAELNGVGERCRFLRENAFEALQRLKGAGERFEVVIADPPSFVKSRRQLKAGLRAYRKLARRCASLVEAGGFLFISSCSHNVDPASFTEAVARGMWDAGRSGRILRTAGAGPDHPVHPALAESAYLKSLVLALD